MTNEQAIKKIQAIIDCDLKELNTMPQHEALQNEVKALELANEALEQPTSDDCVSRQAVLDLATTIQTDDYSGNEIIDVVEVDDIKALPPVTPTHGNCKDCKHNKKSHNAITLCYTTCDLGHRFELREPSTFYCADFEKRGDLDGSN